MCRHCAPIHHARNVNLITLIAMTQDENTTRYVVELDAYIYATSPEDAIKRAKALAESLPSEHWAKVTKLGYTQGFKFTEIEIPIREEA